MEHAVWCARARLIRRELGVSQVWFKWQNEIAPRKPSFAEMLTELLNDDKHFLSAHLLMNSNGQMRRSAAEVYWSRTLGNELTEYEVRHMIYMPEMGSGHEYVPGEMPSSSNGLFGETTPFDMEDAEE